MLDTRLLLQRQKQTAFALGRGCAFVVNHPRASQISVSLPNASSDEADQHSNHQSDYYRPWKRRSGRPMPRGVSFCSTWAKRRRTQRETFSILVLGSDGADFSFLR